MKTQEITMRNSFKVIQKLSKIDDSEKSTQEKKSWQLNL
jgi:hypothetical protein